MVRAFNASARGTRHIKKGKECQDASISWAMHGRGIAVVCDGHGGDDYVRSAVGASMGCQIALAMIGNFLHGTDREMFLSSPDEHLRRLEHSVVERWNADVARHATENPFTEAELAPVSEKSRTKYMNGDVAGAYGTTLLAVGMGLGYWFGLHIGDGRCVAVNPEGKFLQPIPWDKRCFLNVTTSICDADALESFRHFHSEKLPVAVFIGSDGIDDSFANREQLYALYKTALYSFATEGFDEARKNLEDYLPRLSAKGSGDDVSIAALLDTEAIKELDVVKSFDVEKERAKVAATQQTEAVAEESAAANEMAAEDALSTKPAIEDAKEDVATASENAEANSDRKEETPPPVPEGELSEASGDDVEPSKGETVGTDATDAGQPQNAAESESASALQ